MGFMTTGEIAEMVNNGDKNRHSHVIICFDYNTQRSFPIYVTLDQNIYNIIDDIENNNINSTIVIREIYNYKMDINKQLSERKSFNIKSPDEEKSSNKDLDLALEFASEMHKGQCRKDGTPYIYHPIRVANYVAQYKKSSRLFTLMECAYLHDTLEDTKATYYDLLKYFGPQVAGIVLELTNDVDLKKEIGKERYLSIKMKNMTSWALVIKLCDRLDNVSDLSVSSEEFRERYVAETLGILNYLVDNRKLSHSQLLIIREILNQLLLLNVHDTYKDKKVDNILQRVKHMDSIIMNPNIENKKMLLMQ